MVRTVVATAEVDPRVIVLRLIDFRIAFLGWYETTLTPGMSSLYRCDKCGRVVRHWPGKTSLGHIHYGQHGEYLGHDAEGRYMAFPDDGRLGIDDLRWRMWLA